MRLRRHLGSPAVQPIIARAARRARQLPGQSVRDEWPPSERRISAALEPATHRQQRTQERKP